MCIRARKSETLTIDPSLVVALVERITIDRDGGMVFTLRNGMEITVQG